MKLPINPSSRSRAIAFSLYLLPFMINIAIIDFIIPVKYDIILDNLPVFGILITLAWLGSTILDFAVGDLTDKLGIKKTLQIGFILGFIGALIFGFSSNVAVMTFGVFIWGLSYVLFAIPSQTYVLSSFHKGYQGSAFGIMNFALDMAYALSPLLAFVIVEVWGINSAIVIAGFISLLSFVFIERMRNHQKEGLAKSLEDVVVKDGLVKRGFKELSKMNKKEYSILFNVFICGLWFMTIYIASPLLFFIESDNLLKGALLAFFFMLPFAIMELGFGRIADHSKNRVRMIKYGFILSAVLMAAMYFTDNYILLLGLAFLSSFFANMAWVANEVQASNYLSSGKKGQIASIFVTARDIGYDLAPLFYGFIAVLGLKMPFLVLGAIIFIAWLAFMITHKGVKEGK